MAVSGGNGPERRRARDGSVRQRYRVGLMPIRDQARLFKIIFSSFRDRATDRVHHEGQVFAAQTQGSPNSPF